MQFGERESIDTDTFYMNLCLLSAQVIGLIVLKKNNHLFSKKILPSQIQLQRFFHGICDYVIPVKQMIFMLGVLPIIFGKVSPKRLCYGELSLSQGYIVPLLALVCGMVHIAHLVYNSSLISLKELYRKTPLSVTSKIKLDRKAVSKQICIICQNTPRHDAVNPCISEGHVFCRKCLTQWFEHVHELRDNDEVEQMFACPLCNQHIPSKNAKVEITRPNARLTPSTQDIVGSLLSVRGVIMLMLCYNVYAILSHV
jgi:hypothetical protein